MVSRCMCFYVKTRVRKKSKSIVSDFFLPQLVKCDMLKQPYIGKHIFLFHDMVYQLLRNDSGKGGEAKKI